MRALATLLIVAAAGCGRVGFEPAIALEPSDDLALTAQWGFADTALLVFDPIAIVAEGGHLKLRSVDQLDDDGSLTGFGGGAGASVQWNAARGLLEGQQMFVSRVIDAGDAVAWSSFEWMPERPSGKPIPDDGSEISYLAGNADRTGLRLLLHLDETSGPVRDSSGAAHDGTTGGAGYGVPGRFARALDFATSDFVDHGTPAGLDLTGPFTVSAWVRRDQAGVGTWIVSKEQNPPGNGWCLYFADDNTVAFCIGNGSTQTAFTAASFPSTTAWYHVVATHTLGAQRIFVDGIEQSLSVLGAEPYHPTTSPSPLSLGKRFDNSGFLDGRLDEVAVFARTLGPVEVRELYLRGALRIGVQVRSCPDSACASRPFIGPDGTTTTFYRSDAATAALPAHALASANVPSNRYFQYQLLLESDAPTMEIPRLARVAVEPAHVFAGDAAITHTDPIAISQLVGFVETVGAAHTGSVRYQLSLDGVTWYHHAAGAWQVAADLAAASAAADINAACASFADEVGTGSLRWRAILRSAAGLEVVALDEITVRYLP